MQYFWLESFVISIKAGKTLKIPEKMERFYQNLFSMFS